MNLNVTVVIPVYKSEPDVFELVSLSRAFEVFKDRVITLICPHSMDIDKYIEILRGLSVFHKNISVKKFNDFYFQSVNEYNTLMLTLEFYKQFSDYNHILIYQTDAYVFRDELDYWVSKDLDYIGSPLEDKSGHVNKFSNGFLNKGGNGGFSLRRVDSFIKVLSSKKKVKSFSELFLARKAHKGFLSAVFFTPKEMYRAVVGYKNNLDYYLQGFGRNEDIFWSFYAVDFNPGFKAAGFHEAIRFAFEKNPELLYKMNNNQLPFGCHAWFKYGIEFWKEHIPDFKKMG